MNKSILIVDDDSSTRKGLANYLSDKYRVYTASNVHEANDTFNEHTDIGIIVSDLEMPDMSGLDLMDKIHAVNKNIAVIIVSGSCSIASADQVKRLGAYDYLRKPIDLYRLDAIINKVVEP